MKLLASLLPLAAILFVVNCISPPFGATIDLLNNTSTLSGSSKCSAYNLTITVTSNNVKLLLSEAVNQTEATAQLVQLLEPNSTLIKTTNGGRHNITGNYSIYGELCSPSNPVSGRNASTIQFLTHSDTLDMTYWDIAPGYSYIDAAVQAGYSTFSYDRIGVGKSGHPDPVQVVQGPLQVEVAHALITLIREALIGGKSKYTNIVGVGHSAGSTITQGVTTAYPQDLDAVILTGISNSSVYTNTAVASFDFTIANLDASGKFTGLPNGYLVQPLQQGIQFSNYYFPNFPPENLAQGVANKQTQALGELITLGSIVGPSQKFTGPVDIVLGEKDLVFCSGDCLAPIDQSAFYASLFYPSAMSSQHYIVPGAGHNIFAHYSVGQAFQQMLAFLKTNNL